MGTVIVANLAGQAAEQANRGYGPLKLTVVALIFLFLLLPVLWYGALGRFGMTLSPEGLLDRTPLGSMFTPWQARPAAQPTSCRRQTAARPPRSDRTAGIPARNHHRDRH